ncbi:MAG: sigma-70 family RNA polymerase sigma factor [Oscillibacter sp.]|nr:sigma-70 family RNA polymerase sigma factor [Oscillibacter sp.]
MLAICLAMLETEQDQRRFTKLYKAYEKKVYLTALRFLGNPTQAEDAAQQTWVQLLRSWERVCALSWSQTGGYVATVAKNAALDVLRVERQAESFPENWDPPAQEEHQEEYAYLISLIRALPENYRRILELKCVQELSNREIARRLKIKESTVASRVMRGRAMLRECLERRDT